MDEIPPDDFTVADAFGENERIRDALRFLWQLEHMEVLLNSGKRMITFSDDARNAVLDLREEDVP